MSEVKTKERLIYGEDRDGGRGSTMQDIIYHDRNCGFFFKQ